MSIGQLRAVMAQVRFPRALATRHPRGETMGPPGDAPTQRRVLMAGLALLHAAEEPGAVSEFVPLNPTSH